ncbi:MAG: DUF393 domain-containing protein [Deltaproteobacteria bacterium]|nr:DUF393 domain-containing protein [Deltaproteobacteria bacterium]
MSKDSASSTNSSGVGWSAHQFALFRFALGIYLLAIFIRAANFSDLCAYQACLPGDYLPWWGVYLPERLEGDFTEMVLRVLLLLSAVLSVVFALGRFLPLIAPVLSGLYTLLAESATAGGELNVFIIAAVLLATPIFLFERSGEVFKNPLYLKTRAYAAIWFSLALIYLSTAILDGYWLLHLEAPLQFGGPADKLLTVLLTASIIARLAFVISIGNPSTRKAAWFSVLLISFPVSAFTGLMPFLSGVLIAHLLGFNPRWIPPKKGKGRDLVFFDGECGMCHRFVEMAVNEDRLGRFQFAPRGGETYAKVMQQGVPLEGVASIRVVRPDKKVLFKSTASIYILEGLGGLWRVLAGAARIVPLPIRDFIYSIIAAIRHRISSKPEGSCPVVPDKLKGRFLP